MAPIILGKEMTPRHMEIAINDLCALDHIGTMRFENPQDGYGSAPGEERALLTDCPENSGIIQWLCGRHCGFIGPGMTQEDLFDLIIDSGLVSDEMMDLINWRVEEELKIQGEGNHVEEWCEDVPEELQEMWNRYEVANDMEKFEAWENKENMLAAQPCSKGPYMVPDSRTLPNSQWANMWDGGSVVEGEFPFTTMMIQSQRPASHDLYKDPEINKMDEQDRIIVCAQMTQFGSKYHTAMCEFGRIIVPLKFNRYLKDIGENMWLLIRLMPSQRFNHKTGQKMSDRKHPFSCIKVL